MLEPTTNPKTPLWKQLVGALAGAAVAFLVYQAYSFTSTNLEGALVGDRHPRPSGTLSFPDPAVPQEQPSVVGPTSSSSPNALVRIWSSSLRRMIWVTPSSSSSSHSSSITSSVSSVWEPAATSSEADTQSSSSVPFDVRLFERAARRADAAQADAAASPETADLVDASVDPLDTPVTQTAEEPQSMENPYADAQQVTAPEESLSDAQPTVAEALVEPVGEPSPVVASVQAHSGKLPQTGFGLDFLAFTALGAVLGSRKMKRR